MSQLQAKTQSKISKKTLDDTSTADAVTRPPEPAPPGHFTSLHQQLFRDSIGQVMTLMNLLARTGKPATREDIIRNAGTPPQVDHSIRAVPILQFSLGTPEESLKFAMKLLRLSLEMNQMKLFTMHHPFSELRLHPKVRFEPDQFRWVTVDLLSWRLPQSGRVDLNKFVPLREIPDLTVIYAAAMFPNWVKALGTEVDGEFIPLPICRSFQRAAQPGTPHEVLETIAFRRSGDNVLLAGHLVSHCLSDWHYCVPTIRKTSGW